MWPISSSRASRRRIPAYRPSGVRRDDRATKDGSAAYLLGRICSAASTPSPFAFLCELTRRPFGGEARGLRHRVISPSASAGAVLVPCSAAARRSRAALSADARPEKRDRRADRGRRSRARRLATSPATGRPRERGTPSSCNRRRVAVERRRWAGFGKPCCRS